MRVELTRFRVRTGAGAKVAQWMEFLRTNMDAVRETLEAEQMYVETIFSETIDGIEYLYWYSLQGEDGIDVAESSHWIDAKHIEFWTACIDESFEPVDLSAQVTMIPTRVLEAMHPIHPINPGPGVTSRASRITNGSP